MLRIQDRVRQYCNTYGLIVEPNEAHPPMKQGILVGTPRAGRLRLMNMAVAEV
jgi:hypothetical protein